MGVYGLVKLSPVFLVILQIVWPMQISWAFLALLLGVASSIFSSDRPEENRTAIQLRDRVSHIREGRMSPKTRQGVVVLFFAHKNTVSLLSLHRLVATNWLQKGLHRDGLSVEQETGLEPATACLEGRVSRDHRSLGIDWLWETIEKVFL